jgi:Fe-S-cluster formation regulator IscX/YfhJ
LPIGKDAAQESRLVKFELNKIQQGAPALDKFEDDGQVISAKITAAVITMWKVLEEGAQKINADRHRLLQEHQGIKIRTVENFMYASALLEIVVPEGLEESFPMWATTKTEDDGDKLLDTILASLIFVDDGKKSVREMLQMGQHEE